MKYIHKDCGGTIVNRKCSKCGKTWNAIKYYLAKDITDFDDSVFNPKDYRKRIREGRDIP